MVPAGFGVEIRGLGLRVLGFQIDGMKLPHESSEGPRDLTPFASTVSGFDVLGF
jgi:hypothetical protein